MTNPVPGDSPKDAPDDSASRDDSRDDFSQRETCGLSAFGSSTPIEITQALPVRSLGRYRLVRPLGHGGMGEVWLARDDELNRDVAVKTIRRDRLAMARDQESGATASLLEEGRRLAELDHPGILSVFDCGQQDGRVYLVSPFVAGGTLADRLAEYERLEVDEAIEIVARVADALDYAHRMDLVHRDVKPANILMRGERDPLVADFGLATTERMQLSESPAILGTYAYM